MDADANWFGATDQEQSAADGAARRRCSLALAGGHAGAHAAHPERFVRRPPRAAQVPTAAWINPPRPIELVPQDAQRRTSTKPMLEQLPREQAQATVPYLNLMVEEDKFARPMIRQALNNYWTSRASPG